MSVREIIKQALISLDQTVNALLFWWAPGGTWADETLSCRCHRMRHAQPFKVLRPIIDGLALLFLDRDHCFQSYISERRRMQLPPALRRQKYPNKGPTT